MYQIGFLAHEFGLNFGVTPNRRRHYFENSIKNSGSYYIGMLQRSKAAERWHQSGAHYSLI